MKNVQHFMPIVFILASDSCFFQKVAVLIVFIINLRNFSELLPITFPESGNLSKSLLFLNLHWVSLLIAQPCNLVFDKFCFLADKERQWVR